MVEQEVYRYEFKSIKDACESIRSFIKTLENKKLLVKFNQETKDAKEKIAIIEKYSDYLEKELL